MPDLGVIDARTQNSGAKQAPNSFSPLHFKPE